MMIGHLEIKRTFAVLPNRTFQGFLSPAKGHQKGVRYRGSTRKNDMSFWMIPTNIRLRLCVESQLVEIISDVHNITPNQHK